MPCTNGLCLGIDVGSTTVKVVLLDGGRVVFSEYSRHLSQVRLKTAGILKKLLPLVGDKIVSVAISGSAGLGAAQAAGIPFVQEVFATGELIRALEPEAESVIELGGEDAKIIFFGEAPDARMNGTCAGGTGAFIDQMASLLDVTPDGLDELSLVSGRVYPIASRCGVFAKTDVQALLNQGALKSDVAASIFQAVVNQTVAGLARGRKIGGRVVFLGGPLHFCKGLRKRFVATLSLDPENAVFPDYALISVALGAAICASASGEKLSVPELIIRLENSAPVHAARTLEPLFESEEELESFRSRHALASVGKADLSSYRGKAYLGIDCGSTTTKLVLTDSDGAILYSFYASNRGEPVSIILEQLKKIRALCGDRVEIASSAVTGYGEDLIRCAFGVDAGVVETLAHFTAARRFRPNVDFILDIGGQDIKCFGIRNGAIDSIMLNEACSSGCGSFLETFAASLGYSAADFAEKALFAKRPVDLGSRCTVFMNSMVRQSQKDGASVEDISAGLSVSVVKNAIYKVIRAGSADELGENVVVQGGTFYSDAVLRAFEKELGKNVTRPSVAGLMGAYGAALISMRSEKPSTLLGAEELEKFTHKASFSLCRGCANNCRLTVNVFDGGRRFISGNRCEKGEGKAVTSDSLNVFDFKRSLFESGVTPGKRETVGIPLALGNWELLPLWKTVFSSLGFGVAVSGPTTRETYELGQFTIPSDTVCYPAKLMHGHVLSLINAGADAVFYPCLSYNVDEKRGANHYNCPVVAYYSELLKSNMDALKDTRFLYPFLDINSASRLASGLHSALSEAFGDVSLRDVKKAVKAGFKAYSDHMASVRAEGARIIAEARKTGRRILVLAGRPYHADPEISHGIDRLAASLGFAVVSEDCVAHLVPYETPGVLDQWTYHARLYSAARWVAQNPDAQLVQLVSFGCGVDAITTDEVRSILERAGKFYTQIKIDEITNLGAVRIRLRSLLGAIAEREGGEK
ncbi:MAG: 2-hydroxyacyl-CoA dehydratase [Clostridia bacterium]|nr:2-hydroxyacyl-CoA dehydratase [Clostridia bacterium]